MPHHPAAAAAAAASPKANNNPPANAPSDKARIRDNQRRSRARRKEHLADLESRYRECEARGVAAGKEIQRAARAVLEENGRLRARLREAGLEAGDGEEVGPGRGSVAVRKLEGLLGRRWECGGGAPRVEIGFDAVHEVGDGVEGLEKGCVREYREVEMLPPPQPQQQCIRRESVQTVATSCAPSGANVTVATTTPIATNNNSNDCCCPSDMPPNNQIINPFTPDTTSCISIASAIRSIRPDLDPDDVSVELGCHTGAGTECSVSNARAFDVLDRYSEALNNGVL